MMGCWKGCLAVILGLGVAGAGAEPLVLTSHDVLITDFELSLPYSDMPDYLSFGISIVDVTEPFTSRTADLYHGHSLLAQHAPEEHLGDWMGLLMMGGAFGYRAAGSLWTYADPPIIDFARILDGTLDGRIELRIQTGRIRFASEDVHVSLIRAKGDNWGELIQPEPLITSVRVVADVALTLLSPNGDASVRAGDLCQIQWTGGDPAGPILVAFTANNGATWQDVAAVPNTGSYLWRIPPVASAQCRVRVQSATLDLVDESDRTFVIYDCLQNLPGDLNNDCIVSLADLQVLAANWLSGAQARIHFEPLEADPGWVMEGQWAFGTPSGQGGTVLGYSDPASGATGAHVCGVNLNGDHTVQAGGPYSLTAGPFDCRHFRGVQLAFWRWLNTDAPEYVACSVQVRNAEVGWATVWANAAETTDAEWMAVTYDISHWADGQSDVSIRWTYQVHSPRAYPASGWNIDDIELLGQRR